jgi:hypothetical protein
MKWEKCVKIVAVVAVVLLLGCFLAAAVHDHFTVVWKHNSVEEFADGGEIRETRFPHSWIVKKPDGSIWWFDSLGADPTKEMLWAPTSMR